MTPDREGDVARVLDGRLIRLLDGEASEAEREETLRLLQSNPEAGRRYEELEEASRRLSELLAAEAVPELPELDPREWRQRHESPVRVPPAVTPAVRPRRRFAIAWRLAAGIALALGIGLTFQPVRAWLAQGVSRIVELVRPAPPAQQPEPLPVVEGPSTVSFVPEGDDFLVEVATTQAAGRLLIEAHGGNQVTATVLDGAGESLVVLPSGLRIENSAGSETDYRMAVPSGLSRVRVRVGGAEVAAFAPGGTDSPGRWPIELGTH